MPARRVRFRPPGVKPWTRIGPLGPFRGRLGLAWVIAPLVVGAMLVGFGYAFLFRSSAPGGSYRAVGSVSSFPEGSARQAALPGVFVGRAGGRLYAVTAEPGCSLKLCAGRYVDCRGAAYGLDGEARSTPGALDLLPVTVYRDVVYVDTSSRALDRSPAPPPTKPEPCPR